MCVVKQCYHQCYTNGLLAIAIARIAVTTTIPLTLVMHTAGALAQRPH